jgi:hypothetical protein
MRGAESRLEIAVRDATAIFAKFGVDVKALYPTGDEVKIYLPTPNKVYSLLN